tara:strand:- start:4204 stop:5199 length:996 start_codon:yes stop_codon:yes gene_type:complete
MKTHRSIKQQKKIKQQRERKRLAQEKKKLEREIPKSLTGDKAEENKRHSWKSWKARSNNDKVELTCALPMYRAKDIGWLALESLCRQEDIDFKWELSIIEEEEECMGEDAILHYKKRLEEVGCVNISYKLLDEWVPLCQKWCSIAQESDSFGYLLVAADCYSHPKRLAQTSRLLQDYEWVQSKLGPFYNIENNSQSIYDRNLGRAAKHPCSLNMSTRTELMKEVPFGIRRRSVDGWIYDKISLYLGREPLVGYNESDDWKRGVDTNGFNNISVGRGQKLIKKPEPPFRDPMEGEPAILEEVVPLDIYERIISLKEDALKRIGFIEHGIGEE